MGDKIMSKQIADRAMVNTIPGYEGEVDTVEQASKIGAELGYPIMLKASAGGGGTGLKMVRNESQVEENFLLARAEVRAEPCDSCARRSELSAGGVRARRRMRPSATTAC